MENEKIAGKLLKLAKELEGSHEMKAASEVSLDDLIAEDPWVSGLLKKLASVDSVFKHVLFVFSGVHGNIITFKGNGLNVRLTPSDLKKLASIKKIRWVELGKEPTVAIEGSWVG